MNEVGGVVSVDMLIYFFIGEIGLVWWWDVGYFDYGNIWSGGVV